MAVEQSLVLIKPDGLVKSLTGDIISKMSETGLKIIGAKIVQVTRELAEEHYQHLREEKYFDELMKYIMGEFHTKRVLALVYHGEDTIKKIRKIVGETDPERAEPTSIRGKYGRITKAGVFENVVHASENLSEAEREIKLWFRPEELVYTLYPTETENVKIDKIFWKSSGKGLQDS
ncbi:MAG: nucleoside-diphosphate kinase [Nanoarchaeota archaeon]|nr:nucleoside-diphosphate kinase [Nanoarchaeota archaeon]